MTCTPLRVYMPGAVAHRTKTRAPPQVRMPGGIAYALAYYNYEGQGRYDDD